jgi:hypothetical protein
VLASQPHAFEEWRYVRLAVPAWHWDTGRGQGIFSIAGLVQERMRLTEAQQQALASSLRWFNRRLSVPDLGDRRAIFWFKFRAVECRRRVMQLARQLGALGIAIELSETIEPGRIVYEDEWQIAAIPQAVAAAQSS